MSRSSASVSVLDLLGGILFYSDGRATNKLVSRGRRKGDAEDFARQFADANRRSFRAVARRRAFKRELSPQVRCFSWPRACS